jgi:hypothetical protein
MIYVTDGGALRSGRNYLSEYIERILEETRQEICEKLANSRSIDVNSLSFMMEDLSISTRGVIKAEKTLRVHGAPLKEFMRNPIVLPTPKTKDYRINPELLIMLQDNALGTREDNPTQHLREFTHYCETFVP